MKNTYNISIFNTLYNCLLFIVSLCKLISKPNCSLAKSVIGFLELLQLFTEPYITNASYTDYPTGKKNFQQSLNFAISTMGNSLNLNSAYYYIFKSL